MKQILILGGTRFIGRNLILRLAQDSQIELSLFNRQQSNPSLFSHLHRLQGDRGDTSVEQIANQPWDAVVDLSCYFPEDLSRTLRALQGQHPFYIFVSTCSVYDQAHNPQSLKEESTPILSCNARQAIDPNPESYGHRKAECERILQTSGLPFSILRPALVYGAFDPTDRFYYWLYQVQHMQQLLLPDGGERTFSLTYVHDLVELIFQTIAHPKQGTFNAISHPQTSIKEIVVMAMELLGKNPVLKSATPDLLKAKNIQPWMDMPLWIDGDFATFNNERILKQWNLPIKGFRASIQETIVYYQGLRWPVPTYGLKEAHRQALIGEL